MDTLHKELFGWPEHTPLAVIMADIDHFKNINDTHGHLAGDDVLREMTRRMGGAIMVHDSLGRYGGEEFLIVAPGCSTQDAGVQAERLRTCISEQPIVANDVSIAVTMKGVGLAARLDGREGDEILAAADEALYEAKHAGRNRVEVNVH